MNPESQEHRDILKAISDMSNAQIRILNCIEGMRGDMKTMLQQSKDDAMRRDQEYRTEIKELHRKIDTQYGDLHERVNNVNDTANSAAQSTGFLTKGFWFVAAGVIGSLISALFGVIKG